MREEMICYKL